MIKAIVVDDDYYSRKLIIENLICNFPQIKIVAEADSVYSCLNAIHEHTPDLVFLDIELPDGKGFDIFDHLQNVPFQVIFITGHKDYAFQEIKCSPINYLVKPVLEKNLYSAILKAFQTLSKKVEPHHSYSVISQSDMILTRTSEIIYFQKEYREKLKKEKLVY